jgi:hypothetical protein
MTLRRLPSILLAFSAFSLNLLAGPGVALCLNVVKAQDEDYAECRVHAKSSPHVTLIYIDGKKADISTEVDRFLKDVQPHFPAMLAKACKDANLHDAPEVHLHEGVFDGNSFGKGIKTYVPTHGAKAFVSLKVQLQEFVLGQWKPTADEGKATFSIYKLKVNGARYDTPHMTVTQESVRADTNTPVKVLHAALDQKSLHPRYY